MRPSIWLVRSSSVAVILGSSTFQTMPKTMKKPIAPAMTSTQLGGKRGFGDLAAARWLIMAGYLSGCYLMNRLRQY